PHSDQDIRSLPLRTNLRMVIELVETASDDEYRKKFGINHKCLLLQLHSLHFPRSFPADIMHCVLQNVTPTIWRLWNCTKLTVDDPKESESCLEDYYISKDQLDLIDIALAAARADIPTYLSHAPWQISRHYNGFKAAEWDAWL